MKTYTYSEARQRLSALLDYARRKGRVQIRRRDGQLFVLQPAHPVGSPLDVPGVSSTLARGESVKWLRASREESARRLLDRPRPKQPPRSTKPRGKTGARKRMTRLSGSAK